ncbi:MAG: polysaccharide biosynthesis protein [Holosporaceae bacterium]|jgi:FlaA1/EpsC-like NDP-sugar epimerase|nr:polysaccharide biosynthesis protein [Holosporaceae bacterium]
MKNVIIVGAGVAGELLEEDIKNNHSDINVIGFVDDNSCFDEKHILGLIDQLPSITQKYKIDEIIVALPSADGELMRKILLNLLNNKIPVKLIPRTQETINKNLVAYGNVKNFSCEDFLGRAFRKSDTNLLSSIYANKRVFITGGVGSIGSEIVRQLLDLDVEQVIVYDSSELATFNLDQRLREQNIAPERYKLIIGNIVNRQKIDRAISEENPDIIFHAAAYKHVYLMENNIDEAIMNNVIGTKNVIDAAIKNKIKNFVFISTDKVVNPTSIMGATKKLGEFYIKQFSDSLTKFDIVRFGNVINSNGSVLPLFEYQLDRYKYLTVTHKDVKRFFMSIREAAQLVISCLIRRDYGEIYILNMGELIKIYEIAQCLIRSKNSIVGEDVKINIIGLKKGEKMVEELFTESEMKNMEITELNNVYRLKSYDKCPKNINDIVSELGDLVISSAAQAEMRRYLHDVFDGIKMHS